MRTLYRSKTSMERALWRVALHALFFTFALQRALTGYEAQARNEDPVIVACFAMQAVVGLFTAICVMMDRFVIASLAILGTAVTLTGLTALLVSDGTSGALAVTQVFFAVLGTMMLASFLRDRA